MRTSNNIRRSSGRRTDSNVHSLSLSAAILSMSLRSFSMVSFAMRSTSWGLCVHDGAAWGGVSLAICGLLDELKIDAVKSDRCWERDVSGRAIQCSQHVRGGRVHSMASPRCGRWASVASPTAATAPRPSSVRRRRLLLAVHDRDPARASMYMAVGDEEQSRHPPWSDVA